MLQPRIIPCLLVHNKGLVKTTKFKDPKYVGDPINAVKIFNEKEVDELIVVDIDASVKNSEPDYNLIEKLAIECRMPLCYGGGIKTVEQAQRIFSLGVEKIAISSLAIENPSIITELAERVGSQSVVVVLDVKKKTFSSKYEVYINNGKKSTGIDPIVFAAELERLGAGEIVINSIDQDGVMKGYDLDLIDKIRDVISIPLTVLGGAGSIEDMAAVIKKHGIIGVAAGSFFVFKGKFRAVLINYPLPIVKHEMIKNNII
ncbi:AglZ/HisF2 family acetamidino modification protein [Alistipes sp. ZOR0009]|uniref:AglZ/HisF2 family acetamidino modification protein n=1 Tax=Alistipes sp. ZOR0009 TaxID=1339253 RepID=UPI00064629BF|nr:AglZ/HisF2 family acetamidino modification protein [Alistipes sp. ZOR0009]